MTTTPNRELYECPPDCIIQHSDYVAPHTITMATVLKDHFVCPTCGHDLQMYFAYDQGFWVLCPVHLENTKGYIRRETWAEQERQRQAEEVEMYREWLSEVWLQDGRVE